LRKFLPASAYTNLSYTIDYTYNASTGALTGGNDVAITLTPEPSSIGLLGITAMGMLGRRRRRRVFVKSL